MVERRDFEAEARAAVASEVAAAEHILRERGLALGTLELPRGSDPINGADDSELRIYVYRDGNLCDALEAFVWRNGEPAATVSELAEWFRAELAALIT
jgi:hypothetical protein